MSGGSIITRRWGAGRECDWASFPIYADGCGDNANRGGRKFGRLGGSAQELEWWQDGVELGVGSWSAGPLSLGGGAVVENVGRCEALGDSTISSSGLPESHFRNRGLFTKTGGTGTSTIPIPLDNEGIVSASSGTLRLTGGDGVGSSGTGTYTAGAGATVEFASGTYTLVAGSSVTGAGDHGGLGCLRVVRRLL